MASIALKQVSKTYADGRKVLHGIDLQIEDGELLVLVGPSGCGKSTLLRTLAGLEEISDGQLFIGDVLANHIPAAKRGLAMVFQSYALYPHMNVFDNMGFALKMAGHSKAQIKQQVEQAAEILQITPLLQRKPGQLSGGQRQRVAIGRAIVRQPQVFLFDEPLSNLDASLRLQMRLEISRLHQQLKTTMVYVTHDQVEAMTLGQRIVVLQGGKIEQVGTPQELYLRPANMFVAGFLGTPKMNFLPLTLQGFDADNWHLSCKMDAATGSGTAAMLSLQTRQAAPATEQHYTLGIRAEHLEVLPFASLHPGQQENMLPATVAHIEYLGDSAQVYVKTDATDKLLAARLPAFAANAPEMASGSKVWLHLPAKHCHLFDLDGNALPVVSA